MYDPLLSGQMEVQKYRSECVSRLQRLEAVITLELRMWVVRRSQLPILEEGGGYLVEKRQGIRGKGLKIRDQRMIRRLYWKSGGKITRWRSPRGVCRIIKSYGSFEGIFTKGRAIGHCHWHPTRVAHATQIKLRPTYNPRSTKFQKAREDRLSY